MAEEQTTSVAGKTSVMASAVLLTGDALSPAQRNLGKVLDFFGVTWTKQSLDDFLMSFGAPYPARTIRLFCSTDKFLEFEACLQRSPDAETRWRENVHSAFIYRGSDDTAQATIQLLAGKDARIERSTGGNKDPFFVADEPELCGLMAGLPIRAIGSSAPVFAGSFGPGTRKIIAHRDTAVCVAATYRGITVFVTTASEIVDLDAPLTRGTFNIREHMLETLPAVLFVKWAFTSSGWQAPETSACLIIDDPYLKRSYGFVDFDELLALMKQHGFSTNIAFIPRNWNRSDEQVTRLFVNDPNYYSISIHGCDHTRAEYGNGSASDLAAKTRLALARMSRHEESTGIHHDRIMVFPQGVFSGKAMSALKHTEIIASVNNDTLTVDSVSSPITIRDFWGIAITKYDSFPLFTRRYPWEGLENFAFDALLGKPALMVIHQDSCRNHYSRLIEFIDRLNSSKLKPIWRDLSEAVRRSYRTRSMATGVVEVEMFAKELLLENNTDKDIQYIVTRSEEDLSSIAEVRVGSRNVNWEPCSNGISFRLRLGARETSLVRVIFRERVEGESAEPQKFQNEARVTLRRYLSEARDNYVTKARFFIASALGRKDQKWN